MGQTIYYLKQPVKIGDMVTINGLTIELTGQIVQDNPDLFEVKSESKSIHNGSEFHKYVMGTMTENPNPLFTTEDGVEIFEGDKYWWIYDNSDTEILHNQSGAHENSGKKTEAKYFSTREAAEAYIAKHKEKTLEDFIHEVVDEDPAIMCKLIQRYPKLFYTQVLQKIADDLNDEQRTTAYTILYKCEVGNYGVESWYFTTLDSIKFYTRKAAQKAIEIMDDKLDYIYKD